MKIFEKFAAFLFLLLLIGMIAFLTYVPVPEESRQVILIIIGGLMASAATALPRLFGSEDPEKADLKERLTKLERSYKDIKASYKTLKDNYDSLLTMLVKRHVVDGEGFITNLPEAPPIEDIK